MAVFVDGSILAHMGAPDMKIPIRFALTYPDRLLSNRKPIDPDAFSNLTFEKPNRIKFPALDLGYRAAQDNGLAGAVLNAANEKAVQLFLKGAISFDDITRSVAGVMDRMNNKSAPSLDEIIAADRWAREEIATCFSQ